MMSLVTHQKQGSCATFPPRPLSWSKDVKLNQRVVAFQIAGRIDARFFPKLKLNPSLVPSCPCKSKAEALRISSFKGNVQNEESGSRSNGSYISKSSASLSYVQKVTDENMMESPKVHNVPVSYTSEDNKKIAGSLAIRNLFRKWLAMLRTHSPSQPAQEILVPPVSEVSEIQEATEKKQWAELVKACWHYFLRVDGKIKIPLLILIPSLVVIYAMHGGEIVKELTPLWILGPLIIALYIKTFKALLGLYVFTFKQTVKVMKNVPVYYSIGYGFVADGKLKENMQTHFWNPLGNIRKNYKQIFWEILKIVKEWMWERYLDFVESIWPFYCRTIRFLKAANFI